MSTLLYYAAEAFLPAIEKHLATRLEGGYHRQDVQGGPDQQRGALLCAADRLEPGRLKYRPTEQRWQLVDASGRPAYWIGVIEGEEPKPEDLARKKTIPGHLVELADSYRWLCPVARGQQIEDGRLVWYHNLPRSAVLQDGAWDRGPVVPRYARLWQLAESYWQARMGSASAIAEAGDEVIFDFQGATAAAAECLSVNYRLSPVEISFLGLLDTESPRKVLDALIDWPTLLRLSAELQKKTACAASAG